MKMNRSNWREFETELATTKAQGGKIVFCGVVSDFNNIKDTIIYHKARGAKGNRQLHKILRTKIEFVDLERNRITNLDKKGRVYRRQMNYVTLDGISSSFFAIRQGGVDLIYYVEWSE